MRSYSGSTLVDRNLALSLPVVTVAWLLTVPAVLTTSSFLAAAGLLIGVAWVARTTYRNAQPASSLAQSFHDTERAGGEHSRNNG